MPRPIRAALATAAGLTALVGGAATAHAAPAASTPAAVQLQAAHSGKCLTIAGGSFNNGANAVQSACVDGLDNQTFELVPAGGGTFEVRAKHSGKCLEVRGAGTAAGDNVWQWWCGEGDHQRWRFRLVEVAKELFELRPEQAPNLCLEVNRSNLADGANVAQWTCHGGDNQRWRILPVTA
ncbi:beta-xylosidase [Streptomyces chrestomyceticus JCM 4735]|uniref:Beta-xylosidase n=1 Tax=Streptomyces chrestomyceticus JCM 4735 TaxID=1306181 RepID=A0A7U9L049_9ACTN|nr:RICIN domain-containing protein [Streptomyces chrestomyceticus]GCD37773.1 beta-xylosidase [Streptomyces chrestomyceticus JCM 4735]